MNIQSIDSKNLLPFKRIAAIDLGTNSFHAVVVDLYPDGSFRTVDTLKEMVRLAKGGLGKKLTDSAIRRGLTALKNIKLLCENQGSEQILAYATSAIREAENGGEFIQKAIDDLQIKINAIPGKIEAELIGYAVQHGIKLTEKPVLIVDIGGGSVEFVLANKDTFFFLNSKKLGVSRISEEFSLSDPVTPEELAALEMRYKSELKDVKKALKEHKTSRIIGSSGTIQSIAMMIAARQKRTIETSANQMEFTAEAFFEFYASFIRLNRKKRLKVPGIDVKRVDFILPGVVLMNLLFRELGMKKVTISTQALREGIIIRYLKKEMIGLPWSGEFRDPRRRSVFELLRKCQWHEEHSRHVAGMALTLFDVLQTPLGLKTGHRELLEYATLMHDIGYHISHSSHHKHALYLIKHAELKGFSDEEVNIMAHVARYHRRSTPKQRHLEYWRLSKEQKTIIKKLSGILRVADGLDRSHYQNVKEISVELTEAELIISIRSESDPQLEIWGSMRKKALLEQMLDRKVWIKERG